MSSIVRLNTVTFDTADFNKEFVKSNTDMSIRAFYKEFAIPFTAIQFYLNFPLAIQ